MRFGTRERTTSLGRFTSDKCRACKNVKFRMDKKVRYPVVFGIRTIPARVSYVSVCERCGEEKPVSGSTARYLARKHFRGAQFRHQLGLALRTLIVAAIIAALVIMPFAIQIPVNRDPDILKSLVNEDGDYAIKDSSDEVLAIVHVEGGVKTITWYDEVSVMTGTGSRGGQFYEHEIYKEATDSAGNTIMIHDQDDPGQLLDQYHTIIRQYSYDEDTGSLGFYRGVEDLSGIHYSARKVTYPMVYFTDDGEKQQYLTVLYLLHNAQLRAQFAMSASTGAYDRLVSVSVDTLSGTRVTDQAYYYFDDDTIDLAAQVGLTQDSAAQDFADFITVNSIDSTLSCHYEFYGNTHVVQSQTTAQPDANGTMQSVTTNYTVTTKRGYYILQLADGSGEG